MTNEEGLEIHRRKANRLLYIIDSTTLDCPNSSVIYTKHHNDLDEWEEEQCEIYTTEYTAMRAAIEMLKDALIEKAAEADKWFDQKQHLHVSMLWQYDPEKVKDLPPWMAKVVDDVTAGKVRL